MDMSKKIKALLAYNESSARQYALHINTSPQSLAGKFKRNTWNVEDLEKLAEFTGSQLIIQFVNKDGTKI